MIIFIYTPKWCIWAYNGVSQTIPISPQWHAGSWQGWEPTGNLGNQTPVSPQQRSKERKNEWKKKINELSACCKHNKITSYFASMIKKQKNTTHSLFSLLSTDKPCWSNHNNDEDPIAFSQRNTLNPHLCFSTRSGLPGQQSQWGTKLVTEK